METKQLIDWIDSHDRPMPTRDNGDGTLTVYSVVCARAVAMWDGIICEIEADVIPAKLSAARDLLGY